MTWNPVVWVSDANRFLSEVRVEVKKVTWPTQKEAVGGTIGVVVVVAIITAVLGIVDVALGQLVQLVVK